MTWTREILQEKLDSPVPDKKLQDFMQIEFLLAIQNISECLKRLEVELAKWSERDHNRKP